MSLHPHAAGLVATLDPAWRRKLWQCGLVLCVPVAGWPALLGYRARFVRRLHAHGAPALPDWSEGFLGFVREGLLAMAVIFGHLAPLYVAVGVLVAVRGFTPDATAVWLALGFVAFPIFSTLSFPVACLLLARADAAWLSPAECAAALALWAALVFAIPAGFLRVTITGRHRDAFAVGWTLPFVWRERTRYVKAWGYSALMSLCGHLAVPLSPWGVAWCYLAIVALFNELLSAPGGAGSALARALRTPQLQRPRRLGFGAIRDGAGRRAAVADVWWFSAPLPELRRRPAAPAVSMTS